MAFGRFTVLGKKIFVERKQSLVTEYRFRKIVTIWKGQDWRLQHLLQRLRLSSFTSSFSSSSSNNYGYLFRYINLGLLEVIFSLFFCVVFNRIFCGPSSPNFLTVLGIDWWMSIQLHLVLYIRRYRDNGWIRSFL